MSDVRSFLDRVVETNGEATALVDSRGRLTYEELDAQVNRAADVFRGMGIGKGDRVALILPNCREYLFCWFGLAKIGAVHVAMNTRLRGAPLRHQLDNSDPAAVVVGADELEAYEEVAGNRAPADRVLVHETSGSAPAGYASLREALRLASDRPPPAVEIHPGDPLVIMYTSGTTGPAKGVVNPHNAYVRIASDLSRLMGLTSADRMYVFLPLFHGNPQMMGVMPTLAAGGSIALAERFTASGFWEEVRRFEATVFTHIGSPLAILMKQPEQPDDAQNPIRLILGGAPRATSNAFGKRFDCTILDGWGMIEAGCNTTITPVGRTDADSNGVARECFDVRVVDELDRELPPGEVGEIVVRPLEPFVMFSGYFRMPERTLESYRNLWFHTGDLGRKDELGSLFFLGRSKDAIRRKGENISASEIESVLMGHPGVGEAAVVGVPDEIAGQEIKACIVPEPDSELTPEEIVAWCSARMADFMVPRYIVFMESFEKTGSEKIQRYKLRDDGVDDAWDREAAPSSMRA